jgi:hypothetical protein
MWWYAPWDVVRTYVGGWKDPLKRAPPINLIWFFYFGIVLVVLPGELPIGTYGSFVTCLMVILGASLLWCEGVHRKDDKTTLPVDTISTSPLIRQGQNSRFRSSDRLVWDAL